MPIKGNIKIGVIFILILFLIIGGVVMFKTLKHNKDVIDADLIKFVPTQVSSVLQVNKEKDIEYLRSYSSLIGDSTFISINRHFTYPIYFMGDNSKYAILAKVTSEQESALRLKIQQQFSDFPPKERIYKDVTILFFTMPNEQFFCCFFYNGIFAGGYNSNLLEQVIDSKNEQGFFNQYQITSLKKNANQRYGSNLFYLKNDTAFVFNILANETSLNLIGHTNIDINYSSDSINTNKENSNIDYSIFPNQFVSSAISNKIPIDKEPISQLLIAPLYQFQITNSSNQIYALKHKGDKYTFYKTLNNLEFKLSNKRFNTDDFAFANQRIYTTSKELSNYLFNSNNSIYLSFYKGYLIYSDDRQVLKEYLLNNGKYNAETNHVIQNNMEEKDSTETVKVFNRANNPYQISAILNKDDTNLEGKIIKADDNFEINITLKKID